MDTLTPAEVTAVMLTIGEKKASQKYYITFFKAWMAAWMASLNFGAMSVQIFQGGAGTLRTDYPSIINLVAALIFPIGLIMLVLTGQELCTANFMIFIMTSIKKRTKLWELPVNWLIVFFGNMAGALTYVAFLAHYSKLYSTDALVKYSAGVAVTKTAEGWGPCVLRGIGCNFLVCLAVWLGAGARETISKIFALHFPAFAFVFLGFEHVIVNMYYIPIGMLNGANVSVGRYVGRSMIPSLIGNIIGGALLGVPMVLFYTPPELPFFHRKRANSVVVRDDVDVGGGTIGDNLHVEPVDKSTHNGHKKQ
ncbi:hypothetical protein L486_05548 [Kwoniella mangroviensis CBS 10435]|uniref:Formate/nitrite transporter n=1 Tax=Kwoniella mangroviensis CBS 10435 TaxID=1331196 RepID=A0A1B9IMV2_9TREE|nr:uncharacterized protein I203_05679 [Kwoniella mangroviensis CBS 8507]OCF56694.1 hypothetical protein L486_05548 [Kwoniella mangroviensis CBS 10435]OCF65429.1 hypothetical protein I203_05679 [Kwoniella mangroviensis CBS 8507]OCF75268.1 hypothetical protein I204_04121 [Kwoniella mangroviensis CBS 8886]